MTRYIVFSVVAVLLAALTIWGLDWLDRWAERRRDPVEPPSQLDRWDWGGDR